MRMKEKHRKKKIKLFSCFKIEPYNSPHEATFPQQVKIILLKFASKMADFLQNTLELGGIKRAEMRVFSFCQVFLTLNSLSPTPIN